MYYHCMYIPVDLNRTPVRVAAATVLRESSTPRPLARADSSGLNNRAVHKQINKQTTTGDLSMPGNALETLSVAGSIGIRD